MDTLKLEMSSKSAKKKYAWYLMECHRYAAHLAAMY